jgi:uncharacterized protein YabN with tetrapyrrole methylase and pyrophosphatase domain
MEQIVQERGKDLVEMTLPEMYAVWNEIKKQNTQI